MTTKDLLWHKWGVWLSYYLNQQDMKNADYSDVLKRQHLLVSHQDLIAMWKMSPLANLKNFFVKESDEIDKNQWTSYEIDGKYRFINAINYFRDGIKPTWEDPKNATGGRLIFQVDREQENHEQIYKWLVLYLFGQSYPHSELINGVRFISGKFTAPVKFHFRVEIWVSFNNEDMEKVNNFRQNFINNFLKEFQLKAFKPYFKDNKETKT